MSAFNFHMLAFNYDMSASAFHMSESAFHMSASVFHMSASVFHMLTRVGILGNPAVNKGCSEERAGCVEKGKTSWYSGWLFMWVAAQPTQPAGWDMAVHDECAQGRAAVGVRDHV